MKRRGAGEREKEAKKKKLLDELGESRLPYLTPKDDGFNELWKRRYSKLILRSAEKIPKDIHEGVQEAFFTLRKFGCFFQDLVRIKGNDFFTPVSRILIGNPGCTYKYLNTRLFTVPWPVESYEINYSRPEISRACKALLKLNDYMHRETTRALQEQKLTETKEIEDCAVIDRSLDYTPSITATGSALRDQSPPYAPKNDCSVLKERSSYNLTLLNYMDPPQMPFLKQEPYFGMGKMAVSWHHDENLVERSTVAVYSYSCRDQLGNCFTFPILQLGNCFTFPKEIRHRCHFMNYLNIKKPGDSASDVLEEETSNGRDPSVWHVGLKVAWDIKTSGLAIPLHPGDCYFMLDDLNMTHQHCVLAGLCPRFSSTHRVAECSQGTLHYILGRCNAALQRLPADWKDASLQSLDVAAIKRVEETHNEVEFEWLRQFWFQGKRYRKCTEWWSKPVDSLEEFWTKMEFVTSLLLCEIRKGEQMDEQRNKRIDCMLPLLIQRHELRQEWLTRCRSQLAESLPEDEKPECRPYWEEDDPSMPLPFDLEAIIHDLESLQEKMES